MAVRPIITDLENKILRGKAKRVGKIDASLQRLIDDMIDTVRDAPGVGLAAPQVGVPLRVVVIDYEDRLYTLINPEIVKRGTETVTDEEGCLSAPNWQGPVARSTALTVKAKGRDGKELRVKAEGWLARIFQHELDHLDGVIYLDLVEDRSKIHWVEPETGEVGDEEADEDEPVAPRRRRLRTRPAVRPAAGPGSPAGAQASAGAAAPAATQPATQQA
jgi:peptide deformylase